MLSLMQIAGWITPLAGSAAAGLVIFVSSDVVDHAQQRTDAYAHAASNRCDLALPMFERLGAATGSAQDHLAAANCALDLGERVRAIDALQYVLSHRAELAEHEQVYALRAYAFQAEAIGDQAGAALAWRDAFTLSRGPNDSLNAARAARLAGDRALAADVIADAPFNAAEGATLAGLFAERAQIREAAGRRLEAIADLERAIALDDGPNLRFQHGMMLAQAGMTRSAIHALETARASYGDDPDVLLPLAYAYRNAGDRRQARALYTIALAQEPDMARFGGDF